MADGAVDLKDARAKAYAEPLETLDPAQPILFQTDTHWPYFERPRKEDPVHYTPDSFVGRYWSVTLYEDIMAVDTDHKRFSSSWALQPARSAARSARTMAST